MLLMAWWAWAGAPNPGDAARAKIRLIQEGKVRRGTVVSFTAAELNGYAQSELPQGVRQPRLELGSGSATGYALVDFLKLEHSGGANPPWLITKLIQGERPVRVNARIESGDGKAVVRLERVEISGLAVSGYTLDFLIQNFFLPLYPDAKINQPFALNQRVDRIEVNPAAARVVMRR